MYWAQELAAQSEDQNLKQVFTPIAQAMQNNEEKIIEQLNVIQGQPQNIGGYYKPKDDLADKAMRPNELLNQILNQL